MSRQSLRPSRRRYPRYGRFLLTGGAIGLVAAVWLFLGPGGEVDDKRRLGFYLGVVLAGGGALLGGFIAVLVEGRLAPRREKGVEDDDARPGDRPGDASPDSGPP